MADVQPNQLPTKTITSTTDIAIIQDGSSGDVDQVTLANLIPNGAVTPQKLFTGTGTSWAWQAWTPVLTNAAIGNGTLLGAYCQTGKTVHFRLKIAWGTTSSISGNIISSLPVTGIAELSASATEGYTIGTCKFLDATIAAYPGYVQINGNGSTNQIMFIAYNASSTYASQATATATVPFSFGNGDFILATGTYEAA